MRALGMVLRRIEASSSPLNELRFLHDRVYHGITLGRPPPDVEIVARRTAGRFDEVSVVFEANRGLESEVAAVLGTLDQAPIRRLVVKSRGKSKSPGAVQAAAERFSSSAQLLLSL